MTLHPQVNISVIFHVIHYNNSLISDHKIGTHESFMFAENITDLWTLFGIPRVELSQVMNKIPRPDAKIPSEITINDNDGKVVLTLEIPHDKDLVSFTPSAFGDGRLGN